MRTRRSATTGPSYSRTTALRVRPNRRRIEGHICAPNGHAQGDELLTELDDAAGPQGEPRLRWDEHGEGMKRTPNCRYFLKNRIYRKYVWLCMSRLVLKLVRLMRLFLCFVAVNRSIVRVVIPPNEANERGAYGGGPPTAEAKQ